MGARPFSISIHDPGEVAGLPVPTSTEHMAYQVTARKWRPRKFEEVVGQDHITATLANALESGRVAHCYLLCGPRGVGKTTTARILAKALNCQQRAGLDPCDECPSCRSIREGTSMDVLEIDGASNNSVDDVRELREVVRYVPTEGAYKVYIIDEVHMLTTAAFNALLKTLEEPPERVVFIFATTEVQEVPETILSRCQRFNFRRIPSGRIASHLEMIARAEGLTAEEDALYLLAHRADGAMRDAESLLDQVASFQQGKVTAAGARQILGLVDGDAFFDLTSAIACGDASKALDGFGVIVAEGGDVEEFVRGLVEHVRHLLFAKVQGGADKLEVSDRSRARYEESLEEIEEEDALRILHSLLELETDLRKSLQPRFRVEMTLVRLARMGRAVDVGKLIGKLEALSPTDGGARLRTDDSGPAGGGARGPHQAPAPTPAPSARGAAPPALPPEAVETPGARGAATVPDEDDHTRSPSADAEPDPIAPEAAGESQVGPSGAPQVASAKGESGQVVAQWERIVAEVHRTQPSLANFLALAAVKETEEGGVVALGFSPADSFGVGQVKANLNAVEAACEVLVGRAVRIRCAVLEDAGDDGAIGQTAVGEGSAKKQLDPVVKSVMDTFDGELI